MKKHVTLMALGALLASASCFGSGLSPTMRYYWLPIWQGVKKKSGPPMPVVIQVEGLDVDPGYDHLRIVYRISPVQMSHYRLRQWVTKPGRLLKTALQRYLQETGLFRVVTTEPRPLPTYVLRGRIVAIEQVEEGPRRECWSARVALRLRLHRASDGKVIWTMRLDKKERVKIRRPHTVVKRMTRILRERLEKQRAGLVAAIRRDLAPR